jgi:hypothetical protein
MQERAEARRAVQRVCGELKAVRRI